MALFQRLDLRQSQALVMTPQLQQAIKLLQLSNQELTTFIDQELEQNPLLERDDTDPEPRIQVSEDPPKADEPPIPAGPVALSPAAETGFGGEDVDQWNASSGIEGEGDADYAGDAEAWALRHGRLDGAGGEDLPGLDQTLTRETSLRDHLLQQLSVDIDDPVERMIGIHLIDTVGDTGYITGELSAVAETLGCELARVEAALAKLQRFDPPGICARTLAECLALQLRDRNRLDPAMQALLDNLPLVANRDINALIRVCGVDAEDISEMVAEIRTLDPKPGLVFDSALAQPVTPDILMRAHPNGGWLIELNSDTLPRILVNNRYYSRIAKGSKNKADKDYLTERFQSANWLVKSLHQRANTILRVATEIVRQQDAFFVHGITQLRPLILRDIAEAISMHESTVSRVTTNKYMSTPRGIYELKYFFTSSIPASGGGVSHSAEAVRFRIKTLIDAEPGDEVLSDDKIVEILKGDGVDIARRTVAKYREAMRIPSSVQRRREKALRL